MPIQVAYDIRPEQLSGGPAWTSSQTLHGNRQIARPDPISAGISAERFQLSPRREANPAAGYVLTARKNGHKMVPAADPQARPLLRQNGRWQLRATAVDMPLLARFPGVHLHAAVEDRTGLPGRYTIERAERVTEN